MSNYPSLSESYWMDSERAAPAWACLSCDREVFEIVAGVAFCHACKDHKCVVAGVDWEAEKGESYY